MVIRKMESQALAWFHTAGASTNLRQLPGYASQGAASSLNCTLLLCCAVLSVLPQKTVT